MKRLILTSASLGITSTSRNVGPLGKVETSSQRMVQGIIFLPPKKNKTQMEVLIQELSNDPLNGYILFRRTIYSYTLWWADPKMLLDFVGGLWYCWWFRNLAPLGMYKTLWIVAIYHINWCKSSSINSMIDFEAAWFGWFGCRHTHPNHHWHHRCHEHDKSLNFQLD